MAEENVETIVEETVEVEKTVDSPVVEVEAVEKSEEEETPTEKMEDEEDEEKGYKDKKAEKSEEAEEAVAEEVSKSEDVVAEAVEDVAKTISETLDSTLNTLAETVKALNSKIEDLHKTIAGITHEVTSTKEEISQVKGNFDEFGKRVDAVEKDTAFRKSGDLGEIVQEPAMVQKSVWGGRFLKKSDLFN